MNDETERLVNTAPSSPSTRPNLQPVPANRLALDAQIQAAAEYQRRLRQRRRIYYIILITGVTMIIFFILSFVAWIIHSAGHSQQPQHKNEQFIKSNLIETLNSKTGGDENPIGHFHATLNARKHPTRTIKSENLKSLLKRSEMESDEDKDDTPTSDGPTRTRKLSFAPEKIIDYKPKNLKTTKI